MHIGTCQSRGSAGYFSLNTSNNKLLLNSGGGIFEGYSVLSAMPGIGALANGHVGLANVMPSKPKVSNSGVSRLSNPGAGAMTHYGDVRWATQYPLVPGTEILVNYDRNDRMPYANQEHMPRKSVKELEKDGICLDNLHPGKSTIESAGRGAFSSRYISKGTVIAPAPVIPIGHRDALKTTYFRPNEATGEREYIHGNQLLLNYCFGHSNSSLLFFPYSPMVNLINHDAKKPNAKLQWSQSNLHYGKEWLQYPLDKVKAMERTGLLLEVVATRDIDKGEEVLLDYGEAYERAWKRHVEEWRTAYTDGYVYPSTFDDEEDLPLELPENLMTACFYNFGERGAEVANGAGTIVWRKTHRAMKDENLRPCTLLHKDIDSVTGDITYTAKMGNATISKDKIAPRYV